LATLSWADDAHGAEGGHSRLDYIDKSPGAEPLDGNDLAIDEDGGEVQLAFLDDPKRVGEPS
jgi:hypothetical protein